MLEFCIDGQSIKRTDRETVVANSSDYLTAEFNFSNDWKGLAKTAIFVTTSGSISVLLDENNQITESKHLNLSVGTWVVSVVGVLGTRKIITNIVSMIVVDSGASSGTLPPDPTPDIYDQIMTLITLLECGIDDSVVSLTTAYSSTKIMSLIAELEREAYVLKLFGTKLGDYAVSLTNDAPLISDTNYVQTTATSNITIDFVNGLNITFTRVATEPIKLKKRDTVNFNIFTSFDRTCSVEYGAISYINGVAISTPQTFGNQDFNGSVTYSIVQVLNYTMELDLLNDEPTVYPTGTVFTTKLFKRQEQASPTLTTRYLFGVSKNGLDRKSSAKVVTNI